MNALLGSSKSLCVSCFMIIIQVHTLLLGDLTINVMDFELSGKDKAFHSFVLTTKQTAKQIPLPDAVYFASSISYHLLL